MVDYSCCDLVPLIWAFYFIFETKMQAKSLELKIIYTSRFFRNKQAFDNWANKGKLRKFNVAKEQRKCSLLEEKGCIVLSST